MSPYPSKLCALKPDSLFLSFGLSFGVPILYHQTHIWSECMYISMKCFFTTQNSQSQ